MLLTRLPAGWIVGGRLPSDLADSVWAFPVVGAAVGGIGGAVYWLCAHFGMPSALAAVWTLAAQILATGALHEDGLADTADGFGGGRTRARKLEIMRDSRIGTFGALALLLALAARGTSIAALASPGRVAAALVASGALGRGAIVVLVVLLPPARADGLAAGLRERSARRSAVGLALAGAVALALLPFGAALPVIGVALAMALALAWTARRQIGGYTGDVFGAASVATECAVLSLLA
jgi:adenosylcobinamide-GDP ribazoletransferase